MYRELDLAEIQIEAERMGYVVIPIEEYEQLEKALELACQYIAEDIFCPYSYPFQQECKKNCETEGGWRCWKEGFMREAQK